MHFKNPELKICNPICFSIIIITYSKTMFYLFKTNQLSYIGGKHSKAMIKRIMSKLFTDELLKLYSFSGKKGKTKFSNLAVCSVIFGKLII